MKSYGGTIKFLKPDFNPVNSQPNALRSSVGTTHITAYYKRV